MNNNQNNFGMNISDDKKAELLNMASKFLGKDANTINNDLQNGNVEQLISSLSPSQRATVENALKNPKLLSQLLSNPQILKMLGKK